MATVVDRDGDPVVRGATHGIRIDGLPFRTAAGDHDVATLDRGRIRTVVIRALDDLNRSAEMADRGRAT
jgi:hypothetical protein